MRHLRLFFSLLSPLLLCFLALTPLSATSKQTSWEGKVTHVTDGDTLWVQASKPAVNMAGKQARRKIRIEGIDAPELCQPYGDESKAALTKLLLQQAVIVTPRRMDDYGREVAKITFKNQDIGAWMVSQGYAWSYHYRFSAGPYAVQETQAKLAKRGLFVSSAPTEPRLFRREHGSCYQPNQRPNQQPKHTPHN